MKRSMLLTTAILAGCAAIKPMSPQSTLILKPQITSGQYGTLTQISPYTQSSINHLILKLYTYDGAEHDLNIKQTLPNTQLSNPIVFANLKANTAYRIRGFAYLTSDDTVQISDDTNSYTDVVVGNEDRPTLSSLGIKLIDRNFNGQATASGVVVTSGGYQLAGPEQLQYGCLGVVSTFAGSSQGSSNGAKLSAQFYGPTGVAPDAFGNVYVMDSCNMRVRKISSSGIVSTFAGGTGTGFADGTGTSALFNNAYGIAVDATGNVYVADTSNHRIRKITTDGVVTTLAGRAAAGQSDGTGTAAQFYNPRALAVDTNGNIYVADTSNARIRKITSSGVVTTLAGPTGAATAGYSDGTGTAAMFSDPEGIAVDGDGNVYVADCGNLRVRKVTSAGVVSTVAGSTSGYVDAVGAAAKFGRPTGVAIDIQGNVYVADEFNNLVRKITSAGSVSTFAGGAGGTSAGCVEGTGTAVKFSMPFGIGIDSTGNLYVADYSNNRIRLIQ